MAKGRWQLLERLFPTFVEFAHTTIDVGAGNGAFVAVSMGKGMDAHGLDPNPQIVMFANYHLGTTSMKVGAIENTEIGQNQWDLITMFDVLEHLLDPQLALERIGRALRPGGILIIEAPDLYCAKKTGGLRRWRHFRPEQHIHWFNSEHVRQLTERNGLRAHYCDFACSYYYKQPADKFCLYLRKQE
jgi:SAM-dependent methyltransferase